MGLFRCAACGSPNVVMDNQVGGIKYNYVKGAVGTVVLGLGGAAAGVTNETQTVYKCPDCGMTLTYPMSPVLQTMIDMGVASADARKALTYEGLPLSWEVLVKSYKNIESGAADEEIKRREELEAKRKVDEAAYAEELAAFISSEKEKPILTAAEVAEEQKAWELLNKDKLDARDAAIEAAKAENEKEASNYTEELSKKAKAFTVEQERLNQKIKDLVAEKGKLGMFSFGAKKELDQKIAATREELQRVVDESKAFIEANMKNGDPKAAIRAKLPDIIAKINSDFCISESPMEAFERRRAWNEQKMAYKAAGDINGNPEQHKSIVSYCIMSIAEYADDLTDVQYATIIQKCFGYEVSRQRVGSYLRRLMDEDILKRKTYDGYSLYSANR